MRGRTLIEVNGALAICGDERVLLLFLLIPTWAREERDRSSRVPFDVLEDRAATPRVPHVFRDVVPKCLEVPEEGARSVFRLCAEVVVALVNRDAWGRTPDLSVHTTEIDPPKRLNVAQGRRGRRVAQGLSLTSRR
jgi:hypothetical protein